jgi:hypothetical protein
VSRLRLLLLLTSAGALFTGLPCSALTSPGVGTERTPVSAASARAMSLLENAARASRTRTWSGTQHVVSVRDGQPSFTVLEVSHTPGTGSAVHVVSSEQDPVGAVAADVLDAKLLGLLAGHFDLRVAGQTAWAGRPAVLLEARRPGQIGPSALAGRFWLDAATHLVLRRDVLDTTGSVVRSSSFVDLHIGGTPVVGAAFVEPVRATGQRLDDAALRGMEADGWPVVHTLPSGLELFESRLHDSEGADVLQLSYSDGLSTLSLFVQEGELADEPDGTPHTVGGGTVWISKGSPERVVWSGDGRTWTLVSDAPADAVADALLVLPHTATRTVEDGLASRVWRGMSRVGAWLNPFG